MRDKIRPSLLIRLASASSHTSTLAILRHAGRRLDRGVRAQSEAALAVCEARERHFSHVSSRQEIVRASSEVPCPRAPHFALRLFDPVAPRESPCRVMSPSSSHGTCNAQISTCQVPSVPCLRTRASQPVVVMFVWGLCMPESMLPAWLRVLGERSISASTGARFASEPPGS
ncbi:hypothetical protein B0T11DRAFT_77429 [Plectosphaerella cucumerina]|uniref:Uncharacterized protein n=1 Tax=Plectosphaerella cucumerina TaxID=40658 RepID=A0A8K0X2L9_9PEZI|nr:hypothetical protein B0T11DRAFT_77429 [Plectosphaerella cucumerina]